MLCREVKQSTSAVITLQMYQYPSKIKAWKFDGGLQVRPLHSPLIAALPVNHLKDAAGNRGDINVFIFTAAHGEVFRVHLCQLHCNIPTCR